MKMATHSIKSNNGNIKQSQALNYSKILQIPYEISPSNCHLHRKALCACGGACPACQAKSSSLNISQPNDPAEIEADQIADRVMRMRDAGDIRERMNVATAAPMIQTKSNGIRASVSGKIGDRISSSRGGGSGLDRDTRGFMESRFGTDLGNVRIHTGSEVSDLNRSLGAKAFTVGNNIYFNEGRYQPDSQKGKHLLAHELAHTIQQGGSHAAIQRQPFEDDSFPEDPIHGPLLDAFSEETGAPREGVSQHSPEYEAWLGGGTPTPTPTPTPVGPIEQARIDVVSALERTVARLNHAIASRDSAAAILPHDVDDAMCRYFPRFGPDRLEDILARVQPMSTWVPNIPALRVPRPAPASFRDSVLLNAVAAPQPAQAMVRRALPSMAPGGDYIALFPEWYISIDLQATQFLHESYHFSWPGMVHNRSWNDAFAWQGLVSDLGGLRTGAVLQARYPPCP